MGFVPADNRWRSPSVYTPDRLDGAATHRRLRRSRRTEAIGGLEELGEFSTVAIRNVGQDERAVAARLQTDFGDARELFADLVAIAGVGRTKPVEVHLGVEVEIRGRPLARAGILRIEEAGRVGGPAQTPARRSILHSRDNIGEGLAGRRLEQVDVPAFGAGLRERDGDNLAVSRRPEPITRRGSLGSECDRSTTTRSDATSSGLFRMTSTGCSTKAPRLMPTGHCQSA